MSGVSGSSGAGPGDGEMADASDGLPFVLKGVKMDGPSGHFPLNITPVTSGHRSRKEKLVLRSFSTENDEMQMAFDEPKKPVSRGRTDCGSGKRASRTKRTVSAPEHLARKLSMQLEKEDDESLLTTSFDETPPSSSSGSPVRPYDDGEAMNPLVNMDQDMSEGSTVSSPKKPKKRKLETKKSLSPFKGIRLTNTFNKEKDVKIKTKKRSVSVYLKKDSSGLKKNRSKSIPSVFKTGPSRIDKHKFRVNLKKLPTSIKLGKSHSKRNSLFIPKPALATPKMVSPEKPLLSKSQVVSVRKQKKWLPRREISRNMLKSNCEDSNLILKQPLPLDGQGNNAMKPEPKLPESAKSKLPDPHQKTKSKKRAEGDEEGREEQELMHYATGFSCLEELLDGRGKVILPELYLSMIQSLTDAIGGKTGRWGHLLDVFRNTLSESHQKNFHLLLEENAKGVSDSTSKKLNIFQPLFRMAAVLEDKPSVSYPLVTNEEIEAYQTLVNLNLNGESECWDDELECGNLFIDMIEMDLRTLNDNKRTMNAASRILNGDKNRKGLRRVYVKAIPVNYSETQNDHGLFIPENEFISRFLTSKKSVLKQLNTRSLRNGKQVELKNIKLPETRKKHKVKRKSRRKLAKIVPELPIPCPNMIDKETMNLRNGKKITFKPIDTAELLEPSIKLELIPEVMIGSPVKTHQQDDYSRRVEADLRRLEAGEDLLFFDLNNPQIACPIERGIPSQNSLRPSFDPRYTNSSRQVVPLTEPLSVSNPSISRSLFGPPSTSSTLPGSQLRASTPQNQYVFKPIQPPQSSTGSPMETDMWARPEFSSPFLPSEQGSSEKQEQSSPFVQKPYSRHRHSKICPPFDNNHCSFSEHFCSYPRADPAGSRFCLQHAEEGATVNFERCKYVKGSRECGKFIPKVQFQSVFCDMHARAVAKARLKKIKPAKPLDPTHSLLRSIKNDLERTQGKVLEEDGSGYYRVRRHLFAEDNEAVNNSSDSDTEEELVIDDYIKSQGECDSDMEDDYTPPNTLDYDLLKNAGFYSVTEIAKMCRSKLVTLQKLYLRQLELLKKKYVDSRKEFLRKTQVFRHLRTYITTDPKYISQKKGEYAEEYLQHQIKTTQDTRAFLKHARLAGNRALCHMELMKKRQQQLESGKAGRGRPRKLHVSETDKEAKANEIELARRSRKYKRAKGQTCYFGIVGGEKCFERAIPLSKYCRKHIAQDPHQKLFSSCNFRFGPDADDICKIAVLSELEKFGCPLHNLPIPVKDPPEGEDKKPKVEEELEKLLEKLNNSSSSSEGDDEESDTDDEMVREMEDLVGDEVVDLDHFQEMVSYLQNKGLDLTDTEESDDTEEDEQDKLPEVAEPEQMAHI